MPALFLTLIFWVVLREARGSRVVVFVTIYASLLCGNYLAALRDRNEAISMIEAVTQATDSYMQQVLDEPVGQPRMIDIQPAAASASGDAGTMEIVTKQLLNEFAQARNEYLAELEATGWFALLDAGRLQSDTSFLESRRILSDGEAIVRKYRKKSLDMLEGMAEKVRQTSFQSEALKASMLKGMEQSKPKSKENTERMWDLELASIGEMKALVGLLEARRGHYQFANGQVIFASDEDLEAWTKHINAVQELAKRQHELQAEMQWEASSKL